MLSDAGKAAAELQLRPACHRQAIAHDLEHSPKSLMPDPAYPVMKGLATATVSRRSVARQVNLATGKA